MTPSSEMNQKPASSALGGLLFSQSESIHPLLIYVSLLYIGFGSTLSQILLVREFLVSFYGNELGIGILFACWLVWIGAGSAFGNTLIRKQKIVARLFPWLVAATPLITVIQVLAVKFVRVFLQRTTGEYLSMIDLLGCSSIFLSVGCILWGMLFTLGAKLLPHRPGESWSSVNTAYTLESIGSVVGGLLFSFVFVSLLSSLQILLLLAFTVTGIFLWMMLPAKKIFVASTVIFMSIVFFFLLQPLRSVEHTIQTTQWSFFNDQLTFIKSIDTKYQNLSLLKLENQHTVYTDGRPVYNIPNTYDAELCTHPVMIHRPEAKRVLVIGGGFNGVLKEILKYPVQEIDYVETDQALLPFVEPVASFPDQQALHDPRVHIIVMDGREFLRTMTSYDVILMNIGEPSTASMNRFYTVEFFNQCYRSLNGNGVFAFSFPSSEEYLSGELLNLNASIYKTFHTAFAQTLIVPGTHATLIGTKSSLPLESRPDSLAQRYASLGISAEYFTKYMFDELMPSARVAYITKALGDSKNIRLNTDSNPVTYYYDLLLWNKFLQGSNWLFSFITPAWIFVAGSGVFVLGLLFLFLPRGKTGQQQKATLIVIIAIGGMTGMMFNLLILLNFQEAFGSIYEMVGAMIAAHMLGLAGGALAASRLMRNYEQTRILLVALFTLISIVLLFPALLNVLLIARSMPVTLFVTMLIGGFIGILFGIVNRLYLRYSLNLGSVYAFDVLGSSLGALTACSVLLPVLGIQRMTYFFSLLIIPAIVGAWILRKEHA